MLIGSTKSISWKIHLFSNRVKEKYLVRSYDCVSVFLLAYSIASYRLNLED